MESQFIKINHPEYVYHGTPSRSLSGFGINLIDINYWKMNKDFGRGFYTTIDLAQAQEWALKRAEQDPNEQACVLQIRCDLSYDLTRVRQHIFLGESRQWSDYILIHRLSEPDEKTDPCNNEGWEHFDVVIGPMADNNTGGLIDKYKANFHDRDWFYQNIRMSANGDARQGLGLGNQIVYCDETLAQKFLHLHSYWVYDENKEEWHHENE